MIISLILHMKDTSRHEQAIKSVRKACDCADLSLPYLNWFLIHISGHCTRSVSITRNTCQSMFDSTLAARRCPISCQTLAGGCRLVLNRDPQGLRFLQWGWGCKMLTQGSSMLHTKSTIWWVRQRFCATVLYLTCSRALNMIRNCPSHEASTRYLSFLVAASQGQHSRWLPAAQILTHPRTDGWRYP